MGNASSLYCRSCMQLYFYSSTILLCKHSCGLFLTNPCFIFHFIKIFTSFRGWSWWCKITKPLFLSSCQNTPLLNFLTSSLFLSTKTRGRNARPQPQVCLWLMTSLSLNFSSSPQSGLNLIYFMNFSFFYKFYFVCVCIFSFFRWDSWLWKWKVYSVW